MNFLSNCYLGSLVSLDFFSSFFLSFFLFLILLLNTLAALAICALLSAKFQGWKITHGCGHAYYCNICRCALTLMFPCVLCLEITFYL